MDKKDHGKELKGKKTGGGWGHCESHGTGKDDKPNKKSATNNQW